MTNPTPQTNEAVARARSRSLFAKSPHLRTQISPISHYSVALAPPNPDAEAFLFAETPLIDPEGSTTLTQKREHSTTPSPTDSTGQHSTTPATHNIVSGLAETTPPSYPQHHFWPHRDADSTRHPAIESWRLQFRGCP
ncbi:uncharacterized protein DS421_9g271000 [Arachis hypogaea]|nr:uncharacterized protein DS421_9g271000 [Arachis hypogaea]